MKSDTICGLNAVTAVFAKRPNDVLRLYYTTHQRAYVGKFCSQMAEAKRPYRMLEAPEMEKAAGTNHHGGIAVVTKLRIPAIFDINNPIRGKMLLVLDGIGNPHNLGAIARSAAFFGVPAMLIGEGPGNAMPSDAAYRTAEGGMEYLDLYRTRDIPAALNAMAAHYRPVAAALTHDAISVDVVPTDRPIALILGNEETGVSQPVLEFVRRRVRIPGTGNVQSLNVAQAAAVLLHALTPR